MGYFLAGSQHQLLLYCDLFYPRESDAFLATDSDLDDKVLGMARRGTLFQTNAQDYFIMRLGSLDWGSIPDFVIGRPAYDNVRQGDELDWTFVVRC